MDRIRQTILVAAALAWMLLPQDAHAAFQWLSCDDRGGVNAGTSLFYAEQGQEAGDGAGACAYQGIQHIFSQVLCDFLTVLNEILGKVYCSIQFAMIETLRIVLTLYVGVFGMQVLMGTAQLNARDILMRLIKMALVWSFATHSSWGINVMFIAAVSFISDASNWVVNAIPALAELDVGPGHCGRIQFSVGNVMPLFLFFDCLIYYTFAGPAKYASIKVIGLFVSLMLVYPPIAGLAWWWATKTFLTMTRATINFLMALGAIAFLVALTPIFMSLMLFQATSHFFENWLRYMISYCIQVVLVFGVIVMWILVFIQFIWFFDQLANIIFPYVPVLESGGNVKPASQWGICPPVYDFTFTGAPTAQCEFGFDPYAESNPVTWKQSARDLMSPTLMIRDGDFLYFVFYHLVSLMIVTYAFGVVLDQVPRIAQSIASPAALPTVLGGFGMAGFGSSGNMRGGNDNIRGGVGSTSRNAGAGTTGSR